MSIIPLIENTFFANALYWGRLNFPVYNRGSVWAIKTGIHSDDLNMAWSEKPLTASDVEAVRQVLHQFKVSALPFWWWMFPCSKSATSIDILKTEGFSLKFGIPCMVADLKTLEDAPSRSPSITISEVKNRRDLNIWKEVSFAGFDFPDTTNRQYARFAESFNLHPDFPQRLFLAYWNGKPAATSLLFLNETTAGIYFVTTLAGYRKKGIGQELTKATMRYAQTAGMRYVSLQSSPDGLHVYQQAGFKEYCRADIYSLSITPES